MAARFGNLVITHNAFKLIKSKVKSLNLNFIGQFLVSQLKLFIYFVCSRGRILTL